MGSPRSLARNYQISHGVVGKEDALTCQECHVPGGRIDFGQMGYTTEEVAMLTTISSEAPARASRCRWKW